MTIRVSQETYQLVTRSNAHNKSKRWTEDEIHFLMNTTLTNVEIAKRLHRSYSAVTSFKRDLKRKQLLKKTTTKGEN